MKPFHGLLGEKYHEAYRLNDLNLNQSLFVIGPYFLAKFPLTIGGCDRIQPYDNILELLNKYEPKGHVLFEGSLVSDNYGKIGKWLSDRGRDSVVAFLDTPLKECLKRLRNRTEDAGEKNVTKRFEAIQKVRKKFIKENQVRVIDISSDDGANEIRKLLT